MTKLIKRTGKFGTSKSEMINACERYAEENGHEFINLEKHWRWAYCADFRASDGDEFSGVMIAVETGNPDWPEEADVLFGPGQMVGSQGQHIVEENEYYNELGIGE